MPDITYHLATPEEVKDIKYKLAGKDDISIFFDFFKQSIDTQFEDYSKETLTYFTQKDYDKWWISKSISDKSKYIYLAMFNEKIVGFILFSKVYGGVTNASWLAVSPEFQGKGVGTTLVSEWERWAKRENAHSMYLWSKDKNIPFYKKLGFNVSGKFPNAWFGVTTNLLFKTLKMVDPTTYIPNSMIN